MRRSHYVPAGQWRRRSFYETHLYCLRRRKRAVTDWLQVFSRKILQTDHITLATNHLRAPRNVYSRKNQHSLRRRAKLRPYKQIGQNTSCSRVFHHLLPITRTLNMSAISAGAHSHPLSMYSSSDSDECSSKSRHCDRGDRGM